MTHDFSSSAPSEKLTPAELRALLERMEPVDEVDRALNEFDDTVTVSAVAEATGIRHEEIVEILAEVREQMAEARIADAIREMEAPTFRVERPGHAAPDAIRNLPPLSRARLFPSLLDDVVRARRPKIKVKDEAAERQTAMIQNVILIVFGLILIGALALGIRFAMTA